MYVDIGTYNVHFDVTANTFASEFQQLITTTNLDVLGMQEMGNHDRMTAIQPICQQYGWEYYRADSWEARKQVPIAWNGNRWKYIGSGQALLNDATTVEQGAGGTQQEAKWALYVVLEGRSNGKRMAVINWHAPGSIEDSANPLRQALVKAQTKEVELLADQLLTRVPNVFIVGDMNQNYRKADVRDISGFPIKYFKNNGYPANWESQLSNLPPGGTHYPYDGSAGLRIIDHVYSNLTPTANTDILTGYTSDHRPVVAHYWF